MQARSPTKIQYPLHRNSVMSQYEDETSLDDCDSIEEQHFYPTPLEVEAIQFPDCSRLLAEYHLANGSPPSGSPQYTQTMSHHQDSLDDDFQKREMIDSYFKEAEECAELPSIPPLEDINPKANRKEAPQRENSFHEKCCAPLSPVSVTSHCSYSASSQSEADFPPRATIEISPGVEVPLHGSDETLAAMRQGRMSISSCPVCTVNLCCIDTAAYLLCPTCMVVSPVPHHEDTAPGGVGLAISEEDYQQWLEENRPTLVRRRQPQQRTSDDGPCKSAAREF